MVRLLIVSFLVLMACSSIYVDARSFYGSDVYLSQDKSYCVFPFLYNGKIYNDCTQDGDNGDAPWCSLTYDYKGLFAPCIDRHKPSLSCSLPFKFNGKSYSDCTVLSRLSVYPQCKSNNSDYEYMYCAPGVNKTNTNEYKLLPNCNPVYKNLSPYHTMCYGASDFAIPVKLTDDQKQALVDKHNEFRSAVSSTAMFELHYDENLAKVAQARSNLCGFDHDLADNRMSQEYPWKCGQNMVMGNSITIRLEDLVDTMLDAERKNFIYGVGCKGNGDCLHYTQAMLSNLTRVGCAVTDCVYPTNIERYLTCNFDQSQYASTYMTPYVKSDTPASSCPSKNDGGLCDCGEKTCSFAKNEYMIPDTCECAKKPRKRSISERDIEERSVEAGNPFVVVPRGGLEKRQAIDDDSFVAVPKGDLEDDRRKKRHFNIIARNNGGAKESS